MRHCSTTVCEFCVIPEHWEWPRNQQENSSLMTGKEKLLSSLTSWETEINPVQHSPHRLAAHGTANKLICCLYQFYSTSSGRKTQIAQRGKATGGEGFYWSVRQVWSQTEMQWYSERATRTLPASQCSASQHIAVYWQMFTVCPHSFR